jgi:uncharacterized protein YdhG (YjbR/CyaY superfamily)
MAIGQICYYFCKKKMKGPEVESLDAYLDSFPNKTRVIMEQIRELIKKSAPDATESIAYGMPAYKTFNKPLVYFAGYENHIGLYATPSGHAEFKKELAKYKQGKGSIQLPLDTPIPYDLLMRIVEFRVQENNKKFGQK